MTRHPIETLWREVGLPEYFLGNDGTNLRLYSLYNAIVEQCALVCDRHAEWGESKIRDDEPAESTGNQIFALVSNTANDCAEMVRDLKGPVTPSRVPKVRTSHHRNKEEAARLQALVAKRYAVDKDSEASVVPSQNGATHEGT